MLALRRHIVLALFGVAISTVVIAAQGQAPAGQAPPGQAAPAGQRAGGRGQRQDGPPPITGLTVTGEVPNCVPVTDAMLKKPDPGDWLMIRRDYSASDYSPLNQITKDNVRNLELVWRHPMNEGGTNQPAPIVHNGVIYLANTGGIIQAIDGLSGKVIWENHLGSNIAMRGISIYQDKLYLASGNRVIALDARDGKGAWSTEIGQGYSNSSGPLIANGKVIEGLGGCGRYQEEKCYMSAYDAQTGKQLWRFYTIATTGNKGAETWGNLPDRNRAGGEMWITGSYDRVLNVMYW